MHGDGLRRRVHQLFGLAQVEQSARRRPVWRDFGQVERLLARLQRAVRNLELIVEFAQRQVSGGDIADQRGDHGFAVFVRAQKIGARGFGGAPQPAPDIDFEGEQVQRRLSEIAILRGQKLRRASASAPSRERRLISTPPLAPKLGN